MMLHSITCILASCSVGYLMLLYFYWKQMHAMVDFDNLMMDAPHILFILAVVGLIASLI